jgi:hypothetical protein
MIPSRHFSLALSVLLLVQGALLADASLAGVVRPGPVLKAGESWKYDSGLTITFLEVVADTRRFLEAGRARTRSGDRIVRGNAAILLRLEAGNQEPKTVRINTSAHPDYVVIPENVFPEGVVGIPKSYVIAIHSLMPEASKRGVLRARKTYRLRLKVEVAL